MTLFAALAALLATTPPLASADPELTALRAQADAVIRQASASAYFINDTRKDFPAVRHTASGLRCLFQPGRTDNAIIHIGSITGGGMGCVSRPVGFRQTLEAVRLAPGDTLDSVFEKSVLGVTDQEPQAQRYGGAPMNVRVAPSDGLKPAEPKTAAYFVTRGGEPVFSRVSVALVDGWIIRQQFEAPAAQADEAELLAGVVMSTTLIDLASRAAG